MRIIKRQILIAINIIATISILLVLIISVGGFYSDLNWRLAWYSNPRPHFVMAAIIALGWFLYRRSRFMTGVSLLTVFANLFALGPLFISASSGGASTPTLTIAHLNTNRGHADLSALSNITADILQLQEVTPELDEALPTLFASYRVVHSHPLTNTHGSAILIHRESPVEIVSTEIIHLPHGSPRPLIRTEIRFANRSIQLLNLHIIRPHHEWADGFQKVELDAVAAWSHTIQQESDSEVIIVGDFNVTPWSDRFLKLLADGHLNDSLRGYGLQNTWPAYIPLILGLPIDHALHSNGLITVDRSTIAVNGTDHAFLRVALSLKNE